MKADRLRQKVTQRLQELEALAIFTYHLGETNRTKISDARKEVKSTSSKRLQSILHVTERFIAEAVDQSGFTGSISNLVQSVKESRRNHSDKILMFPKWYLDEQFKHYERCFPSWEVHPPHAMIPIDVSGDINEAIWHGVCLPEATLYEDMCASYNQAARSEKAGTLDNPSKIEIKLHAMAVRTTILNAHYFMEAYLNAVAFDFWSSKEAELAPDVVDSLLEWDSKKQRQRWLSLEEKANLYPRIILGVQHSPIIQSNCSELRYLLNEGKKIRDSIVHASPKIDPVTKNIEKVAGMIRTAFPDATMAVDSAVAYVRRLNAALGEYGCDLYWLLDRDATGTFPDAAFQ